jgi:hypothetical protein
MTFLLFSLRQQGTFLLLWVVLSPGGAKEPPTSSENQWYANVLGEKTTNKG